MHTITSTIRPKGLTLVGVIISVMVFGIGMVALLGLLIQTLRAHEYNTRLLEARGLAMEGLEVVRNIRDSNWEQNYPWDKLIGSFPSNCYTDPDKITHPRMNVYYIYNVLPEFPCPWIIEAAPGGPLDNSTAWMYSIQQSKQGAGIDPAFDKYKRFLTFSYIDEAGEITTSKTDRLLVESTVFWLESGKHRQVDLQTIIANWKEI